MANRWLPGTMETDLKKINPAIQGIGNDTDTNTANIATNTAKLANLVFVTDFNGVDPTGAADSTIGIQAAATAAGTRTLYFPAGTYKISSALTPPSGARWVGDNWQNTVLSTSSATADLLTISNSFVSIENLQFNSSVTRTAGNYINISANDVVIRDFYMLNAFQGIWLSAAVSSIWVQRGLITSASTSGIAIRLTGGVVVSFDHVVCTWDGTHVPFAQCYIENGGDYSFTDCQFIHAATGLGFAPGNGQAVSYARFTKCWFDSNTGNGVLFNGTGTGSVTGCDFVQCWFSVSGAWGINVSGAVGPTNISVLDSLLLSNATGGIALTGSNNVKLIGNTLTGASAGIGISLGSSCANTIIEGNSMAGFVTGLATDNTPISTVIQGNRFAASNTTQISGSFSGSLNRVEGNSGYNPVGVSAAVTMGTSPFTYTAGPTSETHYVKQSATNTATIAKGSQQIATLAATTYYTVELGPNESYVTTWTTTAPTYTKDVH